MKYFLLVLLIPLNILLHAQAAGSSSKSGGDAKVTEKTIEKYPKVKWRKKFKLAKKKIEDGSYISASEYLEDAYKKKPDKIQIPHLLAEVNRELRDYEAAEKYYKIVITKDPIAYPADQYFLGEMQMMNGKYDDAKKSLQAYLKTKLDKNEKSYKALAKVEIDGCDSALIIIKNPTKIKVEKTTGINATLNDLSPKPLKNGGVMFAQQKTDTAVDNTTSKVDYYTSIFTAEKAGKAYINKSLMPYPPNDKRMNTGNAILSPDEKTLIYTRCGDSLDLGNRSRCKLFRTTKKDALNWNEPEELTSLNNAEGTTTHPAFGVDADGKDILYFVSDRKGAKGLDIYYAKINSDGKFGAITSAGPEVNTPGDEMTPFYDFKNKQLYFSSNGRPGIGGLDVFKISGTPGHWGAAVNAGVPINSSADDMYFALDDKDAKGFLVSNRVGTTSPRGATCCDDIWTVIVIRDVVLKGIYVKRGDATNTPILGVDASMYKANGNNFDFVANAKTTNVPFVFPVVRSTSYKFLGTKDGFWPSTDNVTIAEEEERDTISQIFYLDPIIKIHIKIPSVYFAFDKSNVIDFYKGQIDSVVKVLNDHPGYSVEIQGHTDSKGSDEYNEKLSMRRANEVKTFLIKKKGIAENRIVAKWFGESQPAVPNELPNGEDDPEGRAQNRRVVFKVIVDKPEDAPEFETVGEVVKEVKTGPGFTYKGKKEVAPKKKK